MVDDAGAVGLSKKVLYRQWHNTCQYYNTLEGMKGDNADKTTGIEMIKRI